MSVQSLTQPLVDAIRRGKQAPTGTLEETDQKIYDLKLAIAELENYPPTTSMEVEQKRRGDLEDLRHVLAACELVRVAHLKEDRAKAVADAGVRVEKARVGVAAAQSKAAAHEKAAWEADEAVREATEEEYQATAALSYLKSPNGVAYGRSPVGAIQRKVRSESTQRDSRMEYLVEMGYAKKVSRKRGLVELEWLVQ